MRFRRAITDTEEVTDINVSPLIDMMFILLIFFIVTTVFVEETGTEVDKPQAASAVELEKNSILLAVTAKGQVVYGGKEIGLGGVRPLVRRLTQNEPLPVIIQVDRNASAGLLVRVIDEAKLGGAKNVSIAAEQGGS
ncbi:MAG: biopolymer transporter ExbD [Verrucomicrobiae bacterium]|nr:biopolymer transporter ExbD [Verrucomicrobiae bacterium]MCX7722338.1 biopolymer transporter ExbD [Verrucomicrobiae bacterium]MDW7979099.1 biopolymer transporter ExbD [Verrucomicrobiales bacterium]